MRRTHDCEKFVSQLQPDPIFPGKTVTEYKFIDSNGKEVMVPDHMNGHPKGNVPPHFNDTKGGHHIYKPEGC